MAYDSKLARKSTAEVKPFYFDAKLVVCIGKVR